MSTDNFQLVLQAGSVTGILCFAVLAIALRRSHPRPGERFWKQGCYEDQDGRATSSAISAFCNILQKRLASLFSFVGFTHSTIVFCLSVKAFPSDDGLVSTKCLHAIAWLLIFSQCVCLNSEWGPTRSYDLSLTVAASTVLLMVNIGYNAYGNFVNVEESLSSTYRGMGWMYIGLAITCASIVLAASITIPRRPKLLHQHILVDEQYTVSALKRCVLDRTW
jgi:hypothetical protein